MWSLLEPWLALRLRSEDGDAPLLLMRYVPWLRGVFLVCVCLLPLTLAAQDKPRVFVLTDISNEPDDEESLVRYLVYSNQFDTEGLIATTSTWLKKDPREDLIRRQVDAYAEVRPNLLKHAAGFPEPESLRAITKTGQTGYGMAFVGLEKSTAGSRHLIEAVDRADARPLWVTVWGGTNTLAQALLDVRASRTSEELARFVGKMRVYTISDQDDAGPWIRKEFPGLYYIVSPSGERNHEYAQATWTGISGDRYYKNGPGYKLELVDNPWLLENVINHHGALGALYPKMAYIMEGDTPTFLGLIDHGLGWSESPAYGGWGGRYVLLQPESETRPIWTNNNAETRDSVTLEDGSTHTSDQATIWRWREHFQSDFAARMDWCVADEFAKANHNPVAVLNGDRTKKVLTVSAKSAATVTLNAEGTSDPDGNATRVTWWIYQEAGTLTGATLSAAEGLKTEVRLPKVEKSGILHVILQVQDDGAPRLVAYRRMILNVAP